MLLPRNQEGEEGEEEPRAELLRRLQNTSALKPPPKTWIVCPPSLERDIFTASIDAPERIAERIHPEVEMKELMLAFADVLRRAERFESHEVQREQLSTRGRMSSVTGAQGWAFCLSVALFTQRKGELGGGGDLYGHFGVGKKKPSGYCAARSLWTYSPALAPNQKRRRPSYNEFDGYA